MTFTAPLARPGPGAAGDATYGPSPPDIQDLYLTSLKTIGIDPKIHDIRFAEDDWESPTLGAWGLGWVRWRFFLSQFTYFQQVAGFECSPATGEHSNPATC